MKKEKIRQGIYTTYKDQQSLGETHDMQVKALPGQSYVKETMHKVSTTQVTGEAVKKVALGGKGGMGSQGDAREQDKQVIAMTRVMVLSDPSQIVFDHNAALDKVVVNLQGQPKDYVYLEVGEKIERTIYNPSHLFGDKNIKGNITLTKAHGRDYDEFSHSGAWDMADAQAIAEYLNESADFIGNKKTDLEWSRKLYDETCGYNDAWKYCRDGYKYEDNKWVMDRTVRARRYVINIVNTLNQPTKSNKTEPYKPERGYQNWEASSYNHNKTVYAIYRDYYYNKHSEEWLAEKMLGLDRKDCAQFMIWQLGEPKVWDWRDEKFVEKVVAEPSEEFLAELDAAKSLEKKRRFEALKNAPDLSDWRIVYNWELTKQGKTMFTNEKI